MIVSLRTSGGRGEYELAGRQGDIHASDLFDRELFYELTPSIVIRGRAQAKLAQGKPRIRLDDQSETTHLYRLLAGVLLMPRPKREFKDTHGITLLSDDSYSMTAIKVDVGEQLPNQVTIRPTDLVLANADKQHSQIEFSERMLRVVRLWDAALRQAGEFAELVIAHRDAVCTDSPNHKAIEQRAREISVALKTTCDPLPVAEDRLGIESPFQGEFPSPQVPQAKPQENFGLEDDTTPAVARIVRAKQWRQIASRGHEGVKFRREVREVYDFRCAFTGKRLPRIGITDSPGVDAAHILPWAIHDNDVVQNGICLDKLCHWAFDEGVLRLTFDHKANAYIVDIPAAVQAAAVVSKFDLLYFHSIEGQIPKDRLPENPSLWPSPKYLEEFNTFMAMGA